MSDSIYVATGKLGLAVDETVLPGTILPLSDENAEIFKEVIREASPEEIAVYEATKVVEEAPVPAKEPVVKAATKTSAEKNADAAAAAAAAAAAGGNGETLV